MKQEILQWFGSGCAVDVGVRLLELYSQNKILIRMVKLDPRKNLDLMVRELSKLANIAPEDLHQPGPTTTKSTRPSSVPSFREEFPFLTSPDCPMELKALVTDKFSSYYRYRELHKKLADCTTPIECADLSREIIGNYLENRAIYAELDYYKRHRTVLGKHPIFKHFHKVAELRKLNIKELVIKQQQIEHNIWRIESEIRKNDKPHLVAERQLRLEQKKAELAEVNRLLS